MCYFCIELTKEIAVSKNTFDYVESILDRLTALKAITSGKFFGGQGIAANSIQFAMIMGDVVFFVVDDSTREKYAQRGSSCFWYTKKTGRVNVRKYYQVPAEILNDQKQLLRWAREAIKIATKLKSK